MDESPMGGIKRVQGGHPLIAERLGGAHLGTTGWAVCVCHMRNVPCAGACDTHVLLGLLRVGDGY